MCRYEKVSRERSRCAENAVRWVTGRAELTGAVGGESERELNGPQTGDWWQSNFCWEERKLMERGRKEDEVWEERKLMERGRMRLRSIHINVESDTLPIE